MGNESVYLPVFGRILIGIFFIFLALIHAKHWKQRAEALRTSNVIMPTLVLWVGILVYFLGGLFLVFHIFICTAVWVLSIAVLIRAILTANFWAKKGEERRLAAICFMTNIALIGGLFLAGA